ncbi:MAG: heme-binding protein [Clostridia bacterium]|nr:heme-binding protein [Clostridia bacterium]
MENTSNAVSRIIKAYLAQPDEMSLELAMAISSYVRQEASKMGVNAVVAISNSGGNPVSVQCMNDSYLASYDVAFNKAYTVVALKMATKTLKPLAQPNQSLYGIQFTNNGKIVIFGGGVPLYNKEGKIIGGLGVSGGSEDQDTRLADLGGEILAACIKNI